MIKLQTHYLREVKTILRRCVPGTEVRAFGSRVTGRASRFSDLDLLVKGNRAMGLGKLGRLKEAFSESTLPIMVDVIDWHETAEPFRKLIKTKSSLLQLPAR